MIEQQDTTFQAFSEVQMHSADSAVRPKHHVLTPAEVVSWLPKDATPEQMDSAIQLHIKPSEVHWSTMPDTLHMPGEPRPKSFRDISLPTYYKQSFFSGDSLYHPELPAGRPGVAGDPVPYTLAGDNFFVGLLLACFVIAVVAISKSRRFMSRQAKRFFYTAHGTVTQVTETASEIRFQIFLGLQTCLLFALAYFIYSNAYPGEAFMVDPYSAVGVYTGVFIAYFLLKSLLYWFTSWVFFDKKSNEAWMKSFLFTTSMEGVALFPIVVLQMFFGVTMTTVIIYIIVLLLFVKTITFYKSYIVFFKNKGSFLQNILYFCALEIIPLFSLWGALEAVNGYFKINF